MRLEEAIQILKENHFIIEGFKSEMNNDKVLKFIQELYYVFPGKSDLSNIRVIAEGWHGNNGECVNWLSHGINSFYSSFCNFEDDYPTYIELDIYHNNTKKLADYLKKTVPNAIEITRFGALMSRQNIEKYFNELMKALS